MVFVLCKQDQWPPSHAPNSNWAPLESGAPAAGRSGSPSAENDIIQKEGKKKEQGRKQKRKKIDIERCDRTDAHARWSAELCTAAQTGTVLRLLLRLSTGWSRHDRLLAVDLRTPSLHRSKRQVVFATATSFFGGRGGGFCLTESSWSPRRQENFLHFFLFLLSTIMDVAALRERLTNFGQGHLLKCWSSLPESEQAALYEDLSSIDLERLTSDFRRATTGTTSSPSNVDHRLQPIPDEACGSISRMKADEKQRYWDEGLRVISEGKAAALLLAGGQGTRLGVPYPKGMYNVDLPSQKTLYQLQAERILKLQNLASDLSGKKCVIPW